MISRISLKWLKLQAVAMLLVSGIWLSPGERASAEEANGGLVIGTGLVIGLPGTGDSVVDQETVEKSIVGVLRHAGLDPWRGKIVPGRIAKVIVTADLPPGARDGALLTITLTAVGDAISLAGGTLLPTLLRAPDGKLYAIGQGPVTAEDKVATAAGRSKRAQDGGSEVAMAQGTVTRGGPVQVIAAE